MMQRVLPALREAEEAYHRRVPTAALNRVIRDAQAAHPPPADGGTARGSSTPPRARPTRRRSPCSPPTSLPPTYLRYLERRIREALRPRPHADQDPGPPPQRLIRAPRRDYRILAQESAVTAETRQGVGKA